LAAKVRKLWTNFSKGELSPRVEGRPDLAAYFEGAKTIENWLILRQGGLVRRPGTRFIAELKDSSKQAILLPFESSVDDSFIVELGHQYARFYKNRARLESVGSPIEVSSIYEEADLPNVHFTQSVDVMYLFHPDIPQRRLSRVSDISWLLSLITFMPPPSFEDDTDISSGPSVTLTPSGVSGTNILFTASSSVFLTGDVGRQIIYGASRAIITGLGPSAGASGSPNNIVRADIIDAFPSATPIPAGDWFLRLSPQVTLDPNIKEPVGAQITLVASAAAFRPEDVGKFIVIYGGLVKVTAFDSVTQVKGEILSTLSDAVDANPPAAPAGSWFLEVTSWSVINGFPRTGEFYQGRLAQASTDAQRATIWLSASDDFENYAIGALADNAIEIPIAARALNRIEWLADNIDLFIGTSGTEIRLKGGREGEPLQGDVPSLNERISNRGSASIQPQVIGRRIIFVDRSRKQIYGLSYNLEEDGYDAHEVTAVAEHITGSGVKLGPTAIQQRPDPRLYFVTDDGELVALTYFHNEKVIGFTRLVTDGAFEAVAVIPDENQGPDQVWVVVRRVINGQTKRFVEMFEWEASEFSTRAWQSLQTDCAKIYNGSATTTITGLSHLEGETVDVVADGEFKGTKVVTGGVITLDEAASKVEVGLHYDSTLVTMRPALEGQVIEGMPRSWDKIWLRLLNAKGGSINGNRIQYAVGELDELALFTGDKAIEGLGWDTEGRVTVTQTLPYPMILLAMFGEISIGDRS
jgi:hypothetical protein